MTRQDPSTTLSTGPNPGRTPDETTGAVREPGPGPRPARTPGLRISAPLCLLAFLALYLLAVCTPVGQRAENALLSGEGAEPAWIYGWSGAAYQSAALPPLEHTAMPTLLVGIAVIVAVTVVRRRWWQGLAALGIVIGTVGSKELARLVLPRPDLVDAHVSLTEASFPSGHVAVPAGLALAATLIASPRVRPYVTAVGMLWLAVTAGAVQATYHHRPSDVLGSTLLACACYALATRFLRTPDAPGVPRHPRVLPAVALSLAAAGALVAGARDDSVTQSLVFAAAAFLCAGLFWLITAPGRHAHHGHGARTSRGTHSVPS
ncbi:phosphatase PAP2 family protein [Streptomyces sp. NPDC001728]|uniref:phosphatase PAP2 family protein n=1 Tax=Streptomyces sp. NPDC001728 TaxID=3154396 RepID=UPI003333A600